MYFKAGAFGLVFLSLCSFAAEDTPQLPLVVPAGVPLRVYLTKRVPKKEGAPVEARTIDPVYSFDHQVIPAGTVVLGRVVHVKPVSRAERFRAIVNGDFTPLHIAPIEFTTAVLPDGRRLSLKTAENMGLDSIYSPRSPKKTKAPAPPPAQNTGVIASGKQKVEDAIHSQIERARSIPEMVRGPDKKERIENYLVAKLPYHPQHLRKGTRIDAELTEPLQFGSEPVPPESLALVGTQPPADTVAHARLITPVDSASSKPGEKVEAALAEPVYSADHKLLLPEGTRLEGAVAAARPARWFHRAGRLRFNFRDIELPEEVARVREAAAVAPASVAEPRPAQHELRIRTEANLQAAESGGKAQIKVDREGGVQAKESKTRFLGLAAAMMVARSAGDNDPIRNQSHQVIGQSQNVGGRTLGGGFGFGLLGMGIAQSSRWVGTAFGYYGMAWSIFSTLIARGSEVQFAKDVMIDVRFDTRTDQPSGDNAPKP